MTPAEKSAINQQIVAQACVQVTDALPLQHNARDVALGMLMGAAATIVGAQTLLTPAARSGLLSRLSRALQKTMDDEISKPDPVLIIGSPQ